jgi:hypothetical protein
MLEAVGHPVAVNPDAALLERARREGWEILRFEKLGQRIRIAGTVLVAAAVGSGGTWLARRRAALLPPLSRQRPRLRDRLLGR